MWLKPLQIHMDYGRGISVPKIECGLASRLSICTTSSLRVTFCTKFTYMIVMSLVQHPTYMQALQYAFTLTTDMLHNQASSIPSSPSHWERFCQRNVFRT